EADGATLDPARRVRAGVVPNDGGRVTGEDGHPLPGPYAAGWITRGPVGLLGPTRSAAAGPPRTLREQRSDGRRPATERDPDAVLRKLEGDGVPYTTWHGWELLDTHERSLGEAAGRERVKVVGREEMTQISRSDRERAEQASGN